MKGLARKKMLKDKKAFQRVYEKGRSFVNRDIVLYMLPTKELSGLVGFAAGKKLGCAVDRNRVKRLLREAYRKHQDELKEGYAIILVGRKPIIDKKGQEVECTYLSLGRKAGIFIGTQTAKYKTQMTRKPPQEREGKL